MYIIQAFSDSWVLWIEQQWACTNDYLFSKRKSPWRVLLVSCTQAVPRAISRTRSKHQASLVFKAPRWLCMHRMESSCSGPKIPMDSQPPSYSGAFSSIWPCDFRSRTGTMWSILRGTWQRLTQVKITVMRLRKCLSQALEFIFLSAMSPKKQKSKTYLCCVWDNSLLISPFLSPSKENATRGSCKDHSFIHGYIWRLVIY